MRFGWCGSEETIPIVKAAGYDYVELPLAATLRPEDPARADLGALRSALEGLGPTAFNVFLPGDLKVTGPAVDAARQERYLQAAFARAAAIGGTVAVFGSAGARNYPEGFSKETALGQIVQFLKLAGPIAAQYGVTVAIEPLNTGESNIVNSVAEGVAVAREVGHPSIQVLSDLYHVDREGQPYSETAAAGSRLRHVHVAGKEGRRAPILDDIDYIAGFFRVLKETAYTGAVSVEGNAPDPAVQAPESLEVLRAAWEKA